MSGSARHAARAQTARRGPAGTGTAAAGPGRWPGPEPAQRQGGRLAAEQPPRAGRPAAGPAQARRGWLAGAAVALPAAVALAADGYGLGSVPLWRDEAYTLDAAHRSVPQIFALLQHTDAVNSAYYLVIHGVIAVAGTSAVALRLPSLLAIALTAALTSAIGQRLARVSALPAPEVSGLLAGLLLVAAPAATYYAQEARSYTFVMMLATAATYLLLRAADDGRWRWWAGYGGAVALAGLFNLLSLLLLAAHAVTLVTVRARRRARPAADGGPPPPSLPRWAAVAMAAVVILLPLMAVGYRERRQISWLTPPGLPAIDHVASTFAGSRAAVPVIAALALAGVLGGAGTRRQATVDAATVALPWLVLPAVILLAASQLHPLFDVRYVLYCLPALALLGAAGLAWLARLTALSRHRRTSGAIAWLPPAVVVAAIGVLLAGPQRAVRLPGSRPDNLRAAAAIVAAHEQPHDAVLYLPSNRRVVSLGYPAAFRRLRDIALARSPVAAANLIGTEVSAATLRQRFAAVRQVWVISGRTWPLTRAAPGSLTRAEAALLQPLRLTGRWYAGADLMLSLLTRPAPGHA